MIRIWESQDDNQKQNGSNTASKDILRGPQNFFLRDAPERLFSTAQER